MATQERTMARALPSYNRRRSNLWRRSTRFDDSLNTGDTLPRQPRSTNQTTTAPRVNVPIHIPQVNTPNHTPQANINENTAYSNEEQPPVIFDQSIEGLDFLFNNTRSRPPTNTEIELATRTVAFGEINSPINNSCPISYEQFEFNTDVMQINHCRHIFSPTNLRRWFETGHQCPVCRHDIRRRATENTDVLSEYTFMMPTT